MRLDATFGRAPLPTADLEFQSDYAKYLCVLVSGFLECAVEALVLGYVERRSAAEVASFVERQLKRWTNPNTDKVIALVSAFNADWGLQTGAFLVDERKEGINSLVANRHKIAHGESVGLSLRQVRSHYETACEVVEFLANMIDPRP